METIKKLINLILLNALFVILHHIIGIKEEELQGTTKLIYSIVKILYILAQAYFVMVIFFPNFF